MDLKFLTWLGHASFLLNINGKNVYLDPFDIASKGIKEHADVILITHPHYDHLSEADIRLIADKNTKIFVPKDSLDKAPVGRVTGVEPGKHYSAEGIEFDTVPAYNTTPSKLKLHPKSNGWVGYIINANGIMVYQAGDTDFISEMHSIKTDLALLPMGGTYVMEPSEMIDAANAIKAKEVAPMHYRRLLGTEGSKAAEKNFLKKVKNGILIEEYGEPKYSF